jgi:hypothetical protein
MAIEDIYVLDLQQSFVNEPLHNIFTYERSTTGTAVDLINSFLDDILPLLKVMISNQITYTGIKAYSLGNLADLDEQVVDETGTLTGDMLPVFNALNYTLKPTSRAVRPGSKRFAGINETMQVNGRITDSSMLAAMEDLRLALAEAISDDDVTFWNPIVVKRVLYDVPDSDPVRQAYRFPTTDEELVFAGLRAVSTTPKISHQVSRGNS